MIVGRWYVQLSAIWHWYLLWCIYITVFNFMLCLSIPFLYFSLILICFYYVCVCVHVVCIQF